MSQPAGPFVPRALRLKIGFGQCHLERPVLGESPVWQLHHMPHASSGQPVGEGAEPVCDTVTRILGLISDSFAWKLRKSCNIDGHAAA